MVYIVTMVYKPTNLVFFSHVSGTRSSLPGNSAPASQAATLGRVARVGVGKAPQMRPEVSEKGRGMSLLVLLVGNF